MRSNARPGEVSFDFERWAIAEISRLRTDVDWIKRFIVIDLALLIGILIAVLRLTLAG